MSFGALGEAAVRAMNQGAKAGGFAHDTGEGGLSRYHKEAGGDLIWQIGTGYFGCRDANGDFDPEAFRTNATLPQVKMIEIKVSQGAKPGHGGILPGGQGDRGDRRGPARARRARTCSPRRTTRRSRRPLEMVAFIAQLRELSGGKPVGFKLCVGDPREFMAIVKAMIADRHLRRLHRRRRRRGRHRCGAAGVLRLPGRAAQRGPAGRPEHAGRRRDPGPVQDRRQRQDGHRVGDGPVDGPRAPTGATRRAPSCSRSAASSRSAATPTSARSGSPPRTPSCSAP